MIRKPDLKRFIRQHSGSAGELAKELLMHDAYLVDDYIVVANGIRYFLADLTKDGPPELAEFLILLCVKKRYSDALLSDLEELFERDLDNGISLRRARIRYWARTLRSIAPQLWAAAKRIGFVALLADCARRLFL